MNFIVLILLKNLQSSYSDQECLLSVQIPFDLPYTSNTKPVIILTDPPALEHIYRLTFVTESQSRNAGKSRIQTKSRMKK